ncbi:unnamed protein product [marine sediment metagenome]|uniref:Uncharacterized protein n=1 Tax=marine sediment metagenome TaxID=412755 RepID=X0WUK8_9ZZZZ
MVKKPKFRPLIRCGCPEMPELEVGGRGFSKCTCIIVSPKTGSRGLQLAPKGKYVVMITSDKNPLHMGTKPFKIGKRRW